MEIDERDIRDFTSPDFRPLFPHGTFFSGGVRPVEKWKEKRREREREEKAAARRRSEDIENDISYLPDSISIRSVLRSLSLSLSSFGDLHV